MCAEMHTFQDACTCVRLKHATLACCAKFASDWHMAFGLKSSPVLRPNL
jgi:hypothetical protein